MRRVIVIVLVLGVIGLLLLGWSIFGDHSTFQTGLDHYEGLPQEATGITLYRNNNISGVFVADFKISEAAFVSFATGKRWMLRPITSSEFVFQAKAFHEGRPNDKKEISDGLYYSQREANGGGVTVAYDRKDGRAYIQSSSR